MTVVHPLLRASIGKVPNTAGYMTVRNASASADRLLSASCACAGKVEVHASTASGMAPAGPVVIPAKGEAAFAPGGRHLMLTAVGKPLEPGTLVEVQLRFEKAGVVKAPFFVTNRVDEEMARLKAGHH